MSKSEKQPLWLYLFLVYICLEASITLWRWLFWDSDSHYTLFSYFIFEGLPFLFLAAITVDTIARRKSNAIFWSKTTLIYFIVVSCLNLHICNFNNLDFNLVRRVCTLCISFAWILYFRFSTQVNQTFPKEERIVSRRDKVLLVLLLIIPNVLGFFAGVVDGVKKARNYHEKILVDASNEYTDGIIAFSIPDGCRCKEKLEGRNMVSSITKDKWEVLVSSGTISDLNDDNLNSIAKEIFEEMRREHQLRGKETITLSVFEQRENSYIFHKKFVYSDFKGGCDALEMDAYVLFCKGSNKYASVKELHPVKSAPSDIEAIVGTLRFK